MILVVEDDWGIREGLEAILEWDYTVLSLPDGAAAKAYLESTLSGPVTLPSLILLDIAMPKMNGFEFRSWQLKQDEFRDIPVIVFSGSHWQDRDLDDLQVDYILVKPVMGSVLMDALKGHIKVFPAGSVVTRKG